jgi:hypothetical protein
MIQRYSPGFSETMVEDVGGSYVLHKEFIQMVDQCEDNRLDFIRWFREVFPNRDFCLVVSFSEYSVPEAITVTKYVDGGNNIVAMVEINESNRVRWHEKEVRANAVQWLCKALMTGLLNKAMEG